MKVSWFKWFMLIGMIGGEFDKATSGGDKRITVEEALAIVAGVAKAAGYEFDDKGSQLVIDLLTKLCEAAADGKITIREAIAFTEEICNRLGIDFDKEGIEV